MNTHTRQQPVAPSPAAPTDKPPRRLRRLTRVWPNREQDIAFLLTLCVEGRERVLANEQTFRRLADFLLDSPARYGWFPRRFVLMPDHLHLIVHQGYTTLHLGHWIKAMKAVVGGLRPAHGIDEPLAGTLTCPTSPLQPSSPAQRLSRLKRAWHWQSGFHDHKFRTSEAEQRKWEYICLNPVRYGLVSRPEDWPYAGEIVYDPQAGPRFVRGTPPLLEHGILIDRPKRL